MPSLIVIASKFFLDPKWLYALLLIVLFLLLYLIRPKPKHTVIPSLMFLFKDQGRNTKTNFFRKLIRDLLFILQLLILLFLIISVAKPYINVTKESLFKNTVLVVDVSASMKADYDGKTRFDEAVKLAKKNLGVTNTLVLVKHNPEVVLIEKSSKDIRDYLDAQKATDTTSNLYDAISTAGGYAKGDSRIVVISDFIDTETDTGIETAKKTLEAQGIKVDFIRVFEPVNNVGIIDLVIEEQKTSAVIKNFNAQAVEVKIKVNTLEETLNIPANSQELFTFSTPIGTSKLEVESIGIKDGFKADNTAHISTPSDIQKKALLITNNPSPEKTFLFNAFDVMKNIEIDVAIPPKIPSLDDYDIFILKDIDPNLILPGTFKGIKKEVETNGKTAIITAQSATTSMLGVNYYDLLPLRYNDTITETTNILSGSTESITANIEFGITKKYFKISTFEGRPVIVLAAAEDQTPIITFSSLEEGKVFFYGILDEDKSADASFAKSPVYFVFWKRLMDFATDTPSIKNLNYLSGSTLNFQKEERIQTPTGKITTKSLPLENAGLYTLNDRVIAINLLNKKESDVNNQADIEQEGYFQSSEKFKEKIPFELTDYMILIAIILLFIEFTYIKLRGDL
ncbi:MAG: VWA domain-containing protein [Nanoarchaeota archaeon]|nr:VWA domain-containing protein [Nanoarchaeota archaeon]MBU1320769.1 VWA domain-containing protein [Nanoarchaeota archaeon]MBU1598136.1 VWA domain-containing protein [Nanoarchaeota archaeon]MBU2441974.1 VWA domain-containing protein [Nanoarchaeota archaeon]